MKAFQAIRSRALWLGGRPADIGQRIVAHYSVYRDSRRNFTFPLLALHGAGWAHGYFRLLDRLLGPYATFRYPLSSRKREELITCMRRAMDGFKMANRRVLADTFANYHFTKEYGRERGADKILMQPLLSRMNALHDATRRGEVLTPLQKATLFSESFRWEQANSVWAMVERTIREVRRPHRRFHRVQAHSKIRLLPRPPIPVFLGLHENRRADRGRLEIVPPRRAGRLGTDRTGDERIPVSARRFGAAIRHVTSVVAGSCRIRPCLVRRSGCTVDVRSRRPSRQPDRLV